MKQTLKSHKVLLTTLSPLFIGAGDEHTLSPYSDYVRRGDSLMYIDTDKLQEAMQGDAALIDAFVKGMRQFDNNRSTFELETFITETLGRSVDDFAARLVRIEGDCKKAQIRRFVATAGKPFIPGSSLKGAIRTAVLVDWLLNRKGGEPALDKIRVAVKKSNQEALKAMNPEQACFGSINHDVFRHLRISDSVPIDVSHLMVGEMKRVALPSKKKKQQQSDIPQWSEMIDRSVETVCSISMTTPLEPTGFDFLDHQSLSELFSIVNRISLESCQRELDELENFDKFRDFTGFYENLEQQLLSIEPEEAILRLGGGKTWHDNSIGLSIDNEEFGAEILFKQYIQLLMNIENLPFPSTRSAIVKNNQPIAPTGWVKLSIAHA
mgnify:CR=1 FL=1